MLLELDTLEWFDITSDDLDNINYITHTVFIMNGLQSLIQKW